MAGCPVPCTIIGWGYTMCLLKGTSSGWMANHRQTKATCEYYIDALIAMMSSEIVDGGEGMGTKSPGGVLRLKDVLGMCRGIGSHFHPSGK